MITKTFMLEVTTAHETNSDRLREGINELLDMNPYGLKARGMMQARIPFTSDQDVQTSIDAKLTTILRRIDDLPARIRDRLTTVPDA